MLTKREADHAADSGGAAAPYEGAPEPRSVVDGSARAELCTLARLGSKLIVHETSCGSRP